MNKIKRDALTRSDRVLVGALVAVLIAASATISATAASHPYTNETHAPVQIAAQDVAGPVADTPPLRMSYESPAEQSVFDKLLREHKCLSQALYYEARGEGMGGEKAVAEVVYNRLRTGDYGNSICDVVFAGAGRPGCQFSFTCNGMMRSAKEAQPWMQASMLAARILTGEERLRNTTGGATSYHSTAVLPDWSMEMVRTAQIGNHIFYRKTFAPRTM
jgi:spore germination cell wall hydrolase CwlJ-like protein